MKTAKAMRIDALQAEYGLYLSHQIEGFGITLNKIWEELGKKDYGEIPAVKLIELYLKFLSTLKGLDDHQPLPSKI